MNIVEWLKNTTILLKTADITTARLDAEVLLADALSVDRSWIQAHPDHILQQSELRTLNTAVKRRVNHEPLAYIRGKQEFYGRTFIVSPDTLTPRPETETMIELLLDTAYKRRLTDDGKLQIIDIGTGSGCIIITAALELPKISNLKSQISYIGLDISDSALKIAQKNTEYLNVSIDLKQYDLTKEPLPLYAKRYTLIAANLPYVPTDFHINLSASHEPPLAIFGGSDGLDYYRALFKQVDHNENLTILTESLPFQHEALRAIAARAGFREINSQDLIQVFAR